MQRRPHIPQLLRSVVRLDSQPVSTNAPSQSAYPAAHVKRHALDMHDPTVLAGRRAMVQSTPQKAQLREALDDWLSQPLAGFMSQSR